MDKDKEEILVTFDLDSSEESDSECDDESMRSSVGSASDSPGKPNGIKSPDEEMNTSEYCVLLNGEVPRANLNEQYSDDNDDDFVHTVGPYCSTKFGLPAISVKDIRRQQLDPVMKLLKKKAQTVWKFLYRVNSLSDTEFKVVFRIQRGTVQHLTGLMESQGVFPTIGNTDGIIKESDLSSFCFLLFLRYLSNAEPLQCMVDELDISPKYLWLIICRVVSWIQMELNYVVTWPLEMQRAKFEYIFGGSVCIGAICSTQIFIKCPSVLAEEYLNKDGGYSVQLQAIATEDLRFTNLYCGEGGSLDIEQVWKRSPLRVKAKQNKLILKELFPENTHLVGKPPYTLSDYIVQPYDHVPGFSFKHAHRKYNMRHYGQYRSVLEAINVLKGRFRRLMYVDYYCLDDVPDIIIASCILHNYCLDIKDTFENPDPLLDLALESFEEGDEDSDNSWSNPKLDVGNDRRGRMIKGEYARQNRTLEGDKIAH